MRFTRRSLTTLVRQANLVPLVRRESLWDKVQRTTASECCSYEERNPSEMAEAYVDGQANSPVVGAGERFVALYETHHRTVSNPS